MIEDINASGARGRHPALARAVGYVSAATSTSYSIFYRGGEPAELMVRGDGSSELGLVVLDEYDREICRKSGRGELLCAWTPAWTAPVRVRIENRGGAGNQFHLLTN